jgi:hypothetical protein
MSLPEYMSASTVAPASHIVFCEVSANASKWLQEAQWVQKMASSQQEQQQKWRALGHTSGTPAAVVPPTKIGAIIAQPPPGFGYQPVPSYSANLDNLQELELARGP